MAFPQDSLTAGEELVLSLHPHWWYLVKSTASLILAIVLGVLVVAASDIDFLTYVFAAAIVGCLAWFLINLAQWVTTWFVLTTERVVFRKGLLSKTGTEIPLAGISAVLFNQRVFERMLGLGDVTIQSSAREGDAVFNDIRKPSVVQKQIYEEMSNLRDREARRSGGYAGAAAAAPAAPAPPSVADQINQLAALRDQGHITEEEFQAKKAELLRRM